MGSVGAGRAAGKDLSLRSGLYILVPMYRLKHVPGLPSNDFSFPANQRIRLFCLPRPPTIHVIRYNMTKHGWICTPLVVVCCVGMYSCSFVPTYGTLSMCTWYVPYNAFDPMHPLHPLLAVCGCLVGRAPINISIKQIKERRAAGPAASIRSFVPTHLPPPPTPPDCRAIHLLPTLPTHL